MDRRIHDEYYRFVFDHSMDALLLTQPDGQILKANPAACELFRMTEDEIQSAGRTGLLDTRDQKYEEALEERKRTGSVRAELTCVRKDGSTFPGFVMSTLFHDPDGTVWTVTIIRDISEQKSMETTWQNNNAELRRIALYDSLTGLMNRRGFMEQCEHELQRAKRNKFGLCVLMLDIDHFKKINDTYGHAVGDQLLQRFSYVIKDTIRPYDIVGRYGGDELVICLPHTSCPMGKTVAERLREMDGNTPIQINGFRLGITISVGVVGIIPDTRTSVDTMIADADEAMYQAKTTRNAVSMKCYEGGV